MIYWQQTQGNYHVVRFMFPMTATSLEVSLGKLQPNDQGLQISRGLIVGIDVILIKQSFIYAKTGNAISQCTAKAWQQTHGNAMCHA